LSLNFNKGNRDNYYLISNYATFALNQDTESGTLSDVKVFREYVKVLRKCIIYRNALTYVQAGQIFSSSEITACSHIEHR
jgi:hypothetical protein